MKPALFLIKVIRSLIMCNFSLFGQLLHELCSAFDLELPFCVKAARFGVTKKLRQRFQKVVIPQISSCLYICQYCLVHLGDLGKFKMLDAKTVWLYVDTY